MLIINKKNIFKTMPLIRIELYNKETCVVAQTVLIKKVLTILKNHFLYQFKILTCISGVDYPDKLYRFQVVYELLSLKYNTRMRVKIVTNELIPVDSVEHIYKGSTWWECEIWDMFGVFFLNQNNLTRLLTDYGFQGFPLRKDFPLVGFIETRFNYPKNRIVYEKVELAQEYRTMDYILPWE